MTLIGLQVKTRVIRKTCNPVYEEEFLFYKLSEDQLSLCGLHFAVLNFDRYSRDHVIGYVHYKLENLILDDKDQSTVQVALDIQPTSTKVMYSFNWRT